MQNNYKEHLYKILVIGDLGVGKTSIIKRYVHQNFSPNYRATIGVDFALKVLNWDQETVRLQLWDIAGRRLITRDSNEMGTRQARFGVMLFGHLKFQGKTRGGNCSGLRSVVPFTTY